MRLLRLEGDKFNLVEHVKSIPPYAILSHTWGEKDDEFTFKDLIEGTGKDKPGYRKLTFCGNQVAKDNLTWFWVDTCCIDKSSSTELSEAINSMFQWYNEADKCYAYLPDVSIEGFISKDQSFQKSRWFTRGWTLQELIAPSDVLFYSEEWKLIGAKSNLIECLRDITKIDEQVLRGAHPSICSIASRMSWAAGRSTTRIEDTAYSLLGIFDINMPMLYGEGERSFIRLQEELLRTSDDQSLFAWESDNPSHHPYTGLLASSPACFANSREISSLGFFNQSESSSMTSKGIHAKFYLRPDGTEGGVYRAFLECKHNKSGCQPAIDLQHISTFRYGSQYIRIKGNTLHTDASIDRFDGGNYNVVYVRQNLFRPLQVSRIENYANGVDDIEWFCIRGTTNFQFSEPIAHFLWNQHIGLFGLPKYQIGRILVTHCTEENVKMSLLFGTLGSWPACKLDDSQILPPRSDFREIFGYGTFAEQKLKKGPTMKNSPIVLAVARVHRILFNSRHLGIIDLSLKTVSSNC
jgi:hypothetical protein